MIGINPEQPLEQRLRKLLAAGHHAMVPPDIIATLLSSRLNATAEGPWVEQHYRPDLTLDP